MIALSVRIELHSDLFVEQRALQKVSCDLGIRGFRDRERGDAEQVVAFVLAINPYKNGILIENPRDNADPEGVVIGMLELGYGRIISACRSMCTENPRRDEKHDERRDCYTPSDTPHRLDPDINDEVGFFKLRGPGSDRCGDELNLVLRVGVEPFIDLLIEEVE